MSLADRWQTIRKGFKPRDVEEAVDYYFHRPLAGLVVQVIRDWPVTPNQVTIASGCVSLVAGVTIGLGALYGKAWAAVGGSLLLLSIVLDCADGQLARVRGVSSPVGRFLDGAMDAVAPTSVMLGMAALLLANGYPHAWVWPIGWAAALSLLWHAYVYDVNKNIYLHCSRPDFSLGGSALLTPDDMRRIAGELELSGQRGYALLMRAFIHWTAPQMRAMKPWLDPARCPRSERERQEFLAVFRRPMLLLTWLGFGTHLFLLTVASLLAPFTLEAMWAAWLVILGPMNAACLWHVATQPRRVRTFESRLAELRREPLAVRS